jgi:two-component system nitrate/nitrite response regulator NarL
MSEAGDISCLVVDDHPVVREGLVRRLAEEADIEVAGQAESGPAALEMIGRRRPDVAVVDLGLPGMDGLELCREVQARGDPTGIVIYTGSEDIALLEAGLEAGAAGFVVKTGPPAALVHAVRAVAQGRTYIDPTLTVSLLGRRDEAVRAPLSDREREVLGLIAGGRTTEQAAAELHLSATTVRTHVERAMQKLSARNRTHAVAEALRQRLIT